MKTRTHPAEIRSILARVDATSGYQAAKEAGLAPKTVYRWIHYRDKHPEWPTDHDIAEFERLDAELAERRAHGAALHRSYLTRRYLARGALMQVPALGTTRRLRALYALGWTSTDLAPLLGVGHARVGHLASERQEKVHRVTAAKVAEVYDRLSMTVPQDPDVLPSPRHCRVHDRQRRMAARRGWAPPLAWDDIDDPDETPTDWRYQAADRADVFAELVLRGDSLTQVCAALKVSRKSLEKWCSRHDLSSAYSALVARENGHRPPAVNQYTAAS